MWDLVPGSKTQGAERVRPEDNYPTLFLQGEQRSATESAKQFPQPRCSQIVVRLSPCHRWLWVTHCTLWVWVWENVASPRRHSSRVTDEPYNNCHSAMASKITSLTIVCDANYHCGRAPFTNGSILDGSIS